MKHNFNLIGKNSCKINDNVSIYIPTYREVVGDVQDTEQEMKYSSLIHPFLVTSSDYMVELYDIGVNFENVSDWQLFLTIYNNHICGKDLYLLFGKHVTYNFVPRLIDETITDLDYNNMFLIDEKTGFIINREMYEKISHVLCEIHGVEKQHRNFGGNSDTLSHVVEREKKIRKRKKNEFNSNLNKLSLAMICNSEFPYNFETIKDISIYDFKMCIKQLQKKYNVDNYMTGIFTGNVQADKINKDDLNWWSLD